MKNALGNDVWEYRTRDYGGWSSDLTNTDNLEATEKDREEMLQKNTVVNTNKNNNRNISRIVPSDSFMVENGSESMGKNSNVTKNSPGLEKHENSSAVKKGWCVIS